MKIQFAYTTFGRLLALAKVRKTSIPNLVSMIVEEYFERHLDDRTYG